MSNIIRRVIRHYFSKSRQTAEPLAQEEALLVDEIAGYDAIISQYIPFFNQLSEPDKRRFMTRVYYFRTCKDFYYQGVDPLPEIPILISAAAVQLTFGLRKYKLTYFKNIYVVLDAYTIPEFDGPIIGHVAPGGIYLSWKHFLEGYKNNEDNVNVAIHEMAHALE